MRSEAGAAVPKLELGNERTSGVTGTNLFVLVPKLRLGNPVFEAPASCAWQAGACKVEVPKQEFGNQRKLSLINNLKLYQCYQGNEKIA